MEISENATLGGAVHQALLLDQEAKEKRDYVGISQIGYCARKIYKEHTRAEKVAFSPKNLMKFLVGHATHDYLQSLLWKFRGQIPGFTYRKGEKEIVIDVGSDYVLKGHADLIFRMGNNERVGDFKIYSDQGMSKLNEKDFNTAHKHYVDQLTMYAYGEGLEECELTYISKDSGTYKTFRWKPDPERVEFLTHKAFSVMKAIDTRQEPPKAYEHPDDDWECSYCPFYNECWNERVSKSDDVLEIPPDLVERFLALKQAGDAVDEELDEVKDLISTFLAGAKGKGDGVTAYYIEPKEDIAYDKKKLEAAVPPEILATCSKVTSKKGYYVIKAVG